MLVSFFEEFPTEENLAKVKLINWPTKLYLATENLNQFKIIKNKIKNKNVKEIVYWPILQKNEGYWISPFSKRKALNRIFSELWGKKIPLMLDLELPKQKKLYFTQLLRFRKNKKIIRNFIDSYKGPIHLAEYYPEGKFKGLMLKWSGLHYNNDKAKVIKMIYHSMHRFSDKFIQNEFRNGINDFGNNFIAGLGTIATGIKGNEPILSVTQLEKDLELARKANVKESVIFRLGGLEQHHTDFIKERPPKVIIVKKERSKKSSKLEKNEVSLKEKQELTKIIDIKDKKSSTVEVLDLTKNKKKRSSKQRKRKTTKKNSNNDNNVLSNNNNNNNNTQLNNSVEDKIINEPESLLSIFDKDFSKEFNKDLNKEETLTILNKPVAVRRLQNISYANRKESFFYEID